MKALRVVGLCLGITAVSVGIIVATVRHQQCSPMVPSSGGCWLDEHELIVLDHAPLCVCPGQPLPKVIRR